MKRIILALAVMVLFAPLLAYGQMSEAEVETRAQDIGQSLRCVVCQNQSIEDSDASLAEDMRRLVRHRVRSGDSRQEVLDFMQQRYGDFVLLKPPVQRNTYLLWGAPFLALLLGGFWALRAGRRKEGLETPPPLSEAEREKLNAILNGIDP